MKRRERKILHSIAALMLMMGLMLCMSAAVYADETHTHNGITFTAWTDDLAKEQYADSTKTASNCLPFKPGSYYLTKNVTLHETWHPLNSYVTQLCLNGKSITIANGALTVISLEQDSTLHMFDCKYNSSSGGGGSIYNIRGGIYGDEGRGVEVGSGCHFIMYGGNINSFLDGVKVKNQGTFTLKDAKIWENNTGVKILSGGTFNMEGGRIIGNGLGKKQVGGGVDTDEGGTFQMTHGEIWFNINYGVRINGNFRIADRPIIHGNHISLSSPGYCDVLLKNKCIITIFDSLNMNATVGVTMDNPGLFTQGFWRENSERKISFNSNDSRYEVIRHGSEELYLEPRSKIVEDMINALPEPTEDPSAVDAAVSEYLSLDDSQKALVSDDAIQKLARLADESALQGLVSDENARIQADAEAKSTIITSAKNKKGKKILVKWKKTSDITGYRILYGTDKNFKNVKEKRVAAKATGATLSNLKKGKTYYIQVQPCTKVTNRITGESNVILGKALNTKKVKIKK